MADSHEAAAIDDDLEIVPATLAPQPAAPRSPAAPAEPPLRWVEAVGLLLWIALADLTIYRGHGFAGWAVFFVFAPAYLFLASPQLAPRRSCWILGGMLWLLAARLVWLGSAGQVLIGLVLLVAFTIATQGRPPFVWNVLVQTWLTLPAGVSGLRKYLRTIESYFPWLTRLMSASVLLPLAALLLFGGFFVLANPDLTKSLGEAWERMIQSLSDWLQRSDAAEWLFWLFAAVVGIGLLRPFHWIAEIANLHNRRSPRAGEVDSRRWAKFYAASRNTLVAVIVLFGIYLVYEFCTMWFREFPQGFYYAGYAHEGAAWLTAALAAATLVLTLIFCGPLSQDPRLTRLKPLAWIWSAENFLLALMVYNRLFIYIDFNGMTRMRTIGLFGVSAVVVGFVLVVWMIQQRRDFLWLIRMQLWTLAAAVYLYALTPVDLLVHRYNVGQILAGDLAPAVQITEHPISEEGVSELPPLTACTDPIIREGIKAMLADRYLKTMNHARDGHLREWSAYQIAERRMLKQLAAQRQEWREYLDKRKREAALKRFRNYAYQWY